VTRTAVVAGGGIGGLAVATALAQRGWQVQVHERAGLTFGAALRSIMRQDPDVILVGEIRDRETAEIAIQASLTGHLVLSTLHTNDAPSTISRLLHMGVEPFLITASLNLIQAQRLVRIICDKCAVPDERVTPEMLVSAELPEHWLETIQPMRGVGCDHCSRTGFKGRRGIFEVMYLTENLRNLIIKGVNSDVLKLAAIEEGMITLRHSALLKLYRKHDDPASITQSDARAQSIGHAHHER